VRTRRGLAALATHRLAAAAGGDAAAAVAVALCAGRHCMAQLAYEEAATTAGAALEALDADAGTAALRADVLLLRGEALLRCGDQAAAREAFAAAADVARAAGDGERLARAALGASGFGVTIIAVDDRVVAMLREALAGLPEPGPLHARILARLAIETYYASTPAERKGLGDDAVRAAQRRTDPGAVVAALNARRVALWSAAYLDERLETATEMVAAAERAGDVEGVLQGRNWRVADLLELGDVDAAVEEVERHERLANRLRLPTYQWWAPMWRSTLAIAAGRVGEAERLVAEFSALGARTGDRNAALYAEIQSFVLAMMGLGTAPPVDAVERERDRPADYGYRSGFAWYEALQGRADAACRAEHRQRPRRGRLRLSRAAPRAARRPPRPPRFRRGPPPRRPRAQRGARCGRLGRPGARSPRCARPLTRRAGLLRRTEPGVIGRRPRRRG
jgi:hypothetical protein